MGKLTDGLHPAINGTEQRLDRVLQGLELLLARAGVSEPEPAPAEEETPPPQKEQVVKLREPKRRKRR